MYDAGAILQIKEFKMSTDKTENFVMLKDATKVGDGSIVSGLASLKTFNVLLQGTGAVKATVAIKGSNINKAEAFIDLAVINLTGNGTVVESGIHEGPWSYYKFTVTDIQGINAVLTGAMGA